MQKRDQVGGHACANFRPYPTLLRPTCYKGKHPQHLPLMLLHPVRNFALPLSSTGIPVEERQAAKTSCGSFRQLRIQGRGSSRSPPLQSNDPLFQTPTWT